MRGGGAAGPDLMQDERKVSAWARVVQGTLLLLTPLVGFQGLLRMTPLRLMSELVCLDLFLVSSLKIFALGSTSYP